MPPARRILNPHLELPQPLRIPAQHPRQPKLLDLLLHPRRQAWIHARPAGEDDRAVEGGADVDVGGLDGVEEEFGDARLLDVDEVGLEEAFGGFEALATDTDDAAVGQGVGFDEHGCVFAEALVEGQVVGDVAEFFFDRADGFEVGGAVERVSAPEEEGDEVAGDISTGHIESSREVVKDGALVYGDDMCDAVAGVDDYSRREALGIEGEHSLDGNVDAAEAVALEHDFAHLLAVVERVHRGLGQQDFAAGRVDVHLVEEGVVP